MPYETMSESLVQEPRTPPLDIRPIRGSPPPAPKRTKLHIIRRNISPIPLILVPYAQHFNIVAPIPDTWPRATLILRDM